MSDLLVGKKLVGPFLRKTVFFIFWGPLKFLLASKTLFCIRNPNFGGVILLRFFDPSNSLWDSQGGFSQKMKFSTFKPLLQSKNVRSMTPPKLRFLMPNKVLEAPKNFQKTPKMKKTVFLKNGPTNFFPTNIPDISEPHGDLLHWNFSWAFTFYISVYSEGSGYEWLWLSKICSVTLCTNVPMDQKGFLSQISVALREWCPMSSQVFGLSLDLITIFNQLHVEDSFDWKYFSKWNWK